MRCRIAAWAIILLLAVPAISACGGGSSGNGVASKSPDAIVADALHAIDNVETVHISGTIVQGTTRTKLDLRLVSGKGGRGHVEQGGRSFELEALGNIVYVNGSAAFWQRFVSPAGAARLAGKWLEGPAQGRFAALKKLTDLRTLMATLLVAPGTLGKGGPTTTNGQSAVVVHIPQGNTSIYVAATGQPYPLQIVQTGPEGGRITLDHINDSVSLAPPANPVKITKSG
jgi:hypothetical protein